MPGVVTVTTPAEARVLEVLAAAPEGLPLAAVVVLSGTGPVAGLLYARAVTAALDALVADGRVWVLPVQTRRSGVVDLFFVPDAEQIARERAGVAMEASGVPQEGPTGDGTVDLSSYVIRSLAAVVGGQGGRGE